MLGIMIAGDVFSWLVRWAIEKLLILFRFDKWAGTWAW